MGKSFIEKLQDYTFSEEVNPVFDFSNSPEKRLFCAMLSQALHDVGRGVGERIGSSRYRKACEALRWIKADFDKIVISDKYKCTGHTGINWVFMEVFGNNAQGVKEAYLLKVNAFGFVDHNIRRKVGRPKK